MSKERCQRQCPACPCPPVSRFLLRQLSFWFCLHHSFAFPKAPSFVYLSLKNTLFREFPGSPGLGLHAFTAKFPGAIPGQGIKIPQAVWHSKNKNYHIYIYTHTHTKFSFENQSSNHKPNCIKKRQYCHHLLKNIRKTLNRVSVS